MSQVSEAVSRSAASNVIAFNTSVAMGSEKDALKFSVSAGVFREALRMVSHTLDKRKEADGAALFVQAVSTNNSPRLVMFATNSSQWCMVRIPAEVTTPGSAIIPQHLLAPVLASQTEDAKLVFHRKTGESWIQLTAGKSRPRFPGGKEGLFSQMIRELPYSLKEDISIPASKLLEVINRTSLFVYKGDDQFDFQNMLLKVEDKTLHAYSAVRYPGAVVAHASVGLAEGGKFEVVAPGPSVESLRRILPFLGEEPVRIIVERKEGIASRVYFRTPSLFYGSVLTSSKFPSVAGAEDKVTVSNQVELDRKQFQTSLRNVEPYCQGSRAIKMVLKDNILRLQSSTAWGNGSCSIDEELSLANDSDGTDSVTIGIDAVKNALGTSKEEFVSFCFTDQKSAVLLKSGNEEAGRSAYVIAAQREA